MNTFTWVTAVLFIFPFLFTRVSSSKEKPASSILSDGIDTMRTLNSLQYNGDFYEMCYYGVYDSLLEKVNKILLKQSVNKINKNCSIFSARFESGGQVFGRNFDNEDKGFLMTRANPPDGYASITFSTMRDFGYEKTTDVLNLSFTRKIPLLYSVYFTADGINKCGVAAALAYVPPRQCKTDNKKETIFITYLIRKILDKAKNTEEAVNIARKYNIFDSQQGILSHHILIADSSGNSVILEHDGEELRVIKENKKWQLLTNSYVYNKESKFLREICPRYDKGFLQLNSKEGMLSYSEAVNVLLSMKQRSTVWSTLADLKKRTIFVSANGKDNFRQYSVKISN